MEYRVGLRLNRGTVVGEDSLWEQMLLGSFVPENETPTIVVVSFPGTKVHGNETSRYRLIKAIKYSNI